MPSKLSAAHVNFFALGKIWALNIPKIGKKMGMGDGLKLEKNRENGQKQAKIGKNRKKLAILLTF